MHDREAQGERGRSYTRRGDVAAEIYDSAIAWTRPAGIGAYSGRSPPRLGLDIAWLCTEMSLSAVKTLHHSSLRPLGERKTRWSWVLKSAPGVGGVHYLTHDADIGNDRR